MLDRYSLQMLRGRLDRGAAYLRRHGVHPDLVTVTGFVLGMVAVIMLACHWFLTALLFILLNRLCDGLDGALARQEKPTGAGAFLDISLDFIFYGAVVFGFALADPVQNGFAASLLLLAFIGTGASFLGFAIVAEQKQLKNITYPGKGFYYLGGLTEGTETLIFFILMCLMPGRFVPLAVIFAILCLLTAASRVVGGYYQLKRR